MGECGDRCAFWGPLAPRLQPENQPNDYSPGSPRLAFIRIAVYRLIQHPDPPVPNLGVFPGELANAIADYLAATAGLTPTAYTARHLGTSYPIPASWIRRDPTPAEQQAIRRVLQATKGNKSEAARLLRTDYKTLHLKMKLYGIPAGPFRQS